jgi:NADP-dependent 3-hydroxy acid dehydrogenase YdfG
MTTIAIVGASRGLGAAAPRRFGRQGFDVALLARRQEHVDELAAQLTAQGSTARGYAADVRDPASLTAGLDRAAATLADTLWAMHTEGGGSRRFADDLDA